MNVEWKLPEDPMTMGEWARRQEVLDGMTPGAEVVVSSSNGYYEVGRVAEHQFGRGLSRDDIVIEMPGRWTLPDYVWPDEPEPETRTPQERALPRTSTTPPMWAQDPNRTRRARTNTRRRHR